MHEPNLDVSRFAHAVRTVETHTAGEPTRVIVSGFPVAPGSSMMERKQWLEEHCDDLRSALMNEPRGHADMVGAVLTDPLDTAADLGVIYLDGTRWINMCGHATMGVVTAAVESGVIETSDGEAVVTLDTPAGLVKTCAKVEGGRVVSVTFDNVPSFLVRRDITVEVDGRPCKLDVSFGGSFFALVDARQLGMAVAPQNVPRLVRCGIELLRKLNGAVFVRHPNLPIERVVNVEFYEPFLEGGGQRNIVISEDGMIDRSPCGTGTCAKLAALFSKGALGVGAEFVNESFLGTRFVGRVSRETVVAGDSAVVPSVTGSANVCGMSTQLIDASDPLWRGFRVEGSR